LTPNSITNDQEKDMSAIQGINPPSRSTVPTCGRGFTPYPTLKIFVVLFAFCISAFAQEKPAVTKAPAEAAQSTEWQRFREGLKVAKPMPEPKNAVRPKVLSDSGGMLRYDTLTSHAFNFSPSNISNVQAAGTKRQDGKQGSLPESAEGSSVSLPQSKVVDGKSQAGASTDSAISTDTVPIHPDITPTKPSPLYYPYSFPFNTEFRMLMRFPVAGFGDQYYLCSASSASDFHLISAAHCIYNHDPLEDGSGRGAGWAAEVWAWPAETDVVQPVDHDNWPDYPYGVSKMTYEVTYNAWINSSDLNWDFSFISLDRRIGDHTGWMGFEWGVNASSLNFDGYPAESPYVPSNNPYQYPGFDSGNVIGYTCCRIELSAYTYGGHSGGGVWRYDGTNRYIEGVNSTSNRAGYAEATLLRGSNYTDLQNTIANDRNVRPPVDRAQLIEYVFNGTSKGLLTTAVSLGQSLGVTLNAFNAGYASAGDTIAYMYLTPYESSVTAGTYIGYLDLGTLGAYTYTVQNRYITVPAYVTPGYYYVGWALGGTNSQYGTDQNTAIITNQVLHVVGLSSISATPNTVTGGTSSSAYLALTGTAPPSGVDIAISSNNAAVHVPSSVHVNGGASSVSFLITTSAVSSTTVGTITANGSGVIRTTTLTVKPPALSSISLVPTTVMGTVSSIATIHMTGPAPAAGLTLTLASSNSKATVPATLHLGPGASVGTFTVKTVQVYSPTSATIKATFAGVSKTTGLTINPVEPVSLTLSPTSVKGGTSSHGTLTINGPAPSAGVTIPLSSTSTHAKVPATVHFSSGVKSVTFTVTTTAVTANTTATIKGTFSGVSKTGTLTVTK
jgi:hypothetical protein